MNIPREMEPLKNSSDELLSLHASLRARSVRQLWIVLRLAIVVHTLSACLFAWGAASLTSPLALTSAVTAGLMLCLHAWLRIRGDRAYVLVGVSVMLLGQICALTLIGISGSAVFAALLMLCLWASANVFAELTLTVGLSITAVGGWYFALSVVQPQDRLIWTFYLFVAVLGGLVDAWSRRGWLARLHYRTYEAETASRLATEREISLAQARDAALASAKAKHEFLANVSHEIRTPLHGIIGLLDLVPDASLGKEHGDYLVQAKESSGTLLHIVNELLDLSKIESGAMELESVPFTVGELVDDVVGNHAAMAAAKGIALYAEVDGRVPREVCGDPLRIRQVITNLVSNALKFTEQGAVRVSVRLQDRSDSQATLEFRVTDTGIGIAKNQQAAILQPFTQADSSTTRHYGGTGLGLSISSQLVELMGGRLRVKSDVGQGSTFYFAAVFDLDQQLSPRLEVVSRGLEGVRILVLERNDRLRASLEYQLHSWGMDVCAVSSLAEADARVRQDEQPFRLAMLDLKSLNADWEAQAAEFIASADDKGCATIAVATPTRSAERLVTLGMASSLMKPIRRANLLAALLHALDNASADNRAKKESGVIRKRVGQAGTLSPGTHILVAEDNAINRTLVLAHLQRLGCSVDAVGDGAEAAKRISDGHLYSLVLMDGQMPNVDGYEAARRIRMWERKNDARPVPIIALTAHATENSRQKALQAGMNDYLVKPYRIPELRAVIERWGSSPRSEQEVELVAAVAKQLTDLEKDSPGFLTELIESFEENGRRELVAIRNAIERGDADAMCASAHSLKGSAQQLGAATLGHYVGGLETPVDTGSARTLLGKAEQEFPHVLRALRALEARTCSPFDAAAGSEIGGC